MMQRGKTFIVSGPSGVGKSTVLKALFAQRSDLYFSVSATTRAPREGEVDGTHYHFLTQTEFEEMIGRDEFLEHAQYVGNYYGTPKKYVDAAMEEGRDVILDIEVQGAQQICAKRPETVRIFVGPPSWQELERRLTARGTDTPEKVQQRLQRARVEMQSAEEYDYLVINDQLEQAVEELKAILCAEHCRPADRLDRILE
ncbi:MAG: guanylate kinase [Ruminococcaceae bacterium]|nr:guanylate kinase [Oscillospiraceae bacterium]